MFLKTLLRDNPALGDYALHLHKKGLIQPDTYVIDADALVQNALDFRLRAAGLGIIPYPMTKQIGRNPYILNLLRQEGFAFCAVDFREALTFAQEGCPLGHVGHLVQVPLSLISSLLGHRPKYWTVYSWEQASDLNGAAKAQGIIQKVLLRPLVEPYPGQESPAHSPQSLLDFAQRVASLKNLEICGLTSFPCFLYQNSAIGATANAFLLDKCFNTLLDAGFKLSVKNMPSHNCLEALPSRATAPPIQRAAVLKKSPSATSPRFPTRPRVEAMPSGADGTAVPSGKGLSLGAKKQYSARTRPTISTIPMPLKAVIPSEREF